MAQAVLNPVGWAREYDPHQRKDASPRLSIRWLPVPRALQVTGRYRRGLPLCLDITHEGHRLGAVAKVVIRPAVDPGLERACADGQISSTGGQVTSTQRGAAFEGLGDHLFVECLHVDPCDIALPTPWAASTVKPPTPSPGASVNWTIRPESICT